MNLFPKTTASFKIADQVMGSVTSIGANFVEAQFARSKKEFISVIGIVLKETKETLFWLDTIEDLQLATNKERLKNVYQECSELAKIFISIVMTASGKSRQ